jgi:Sel1 repeat
MGRNRKSQTASKVAAGVNGEAPKAFSPLALAFLFVLALGLWPLLPRVGENWKLALSFEVAAGSLLILLLVLWNRVALTGRKLSYDIVPKSAHYVQLAMHSCVYAYWGWYWREVYREIPLILGQIVFVYALDMIVCWFRRDKWLLGFGPFPIILSTNLFLWFRDDWFFLQFVLIAVGVLGKEFVKWERDGKKVHIFNPSALSLFVFSVILIATKSTNLTWGLEIANTFHRPPHIYMELFLLGLVVQSLFGVTLVTLAAAAALYFMNLAYTHATGVYHFVDSNIPVAVFLGLHLLVTDPATSPRKNFGKIIFGALYGVGVFAAYGALGWFGAPEFYDKLLCVPILNLSVRYFDHLTDWAAAVVRSWGASWKLNQRATNFACMGVWTCLFTVMMGTGFLNKGQDFPGGRPEFWHQACDQNKWNACKTWVRVLNDQCQDGSSDACLSLGMATNEGRIVPRNETAAGEAFGRACDLGLSQGCKSLIDFVGGDGKDVFRQACDRGRGASCFLLGTLYSSGLGVPRNGDEAFNLFKKSCEVGWWRGCGRLGQSYLVGQGTPVDPAKAIENFDKGCDGGNAASCFQVAELYRRGLGGNENDELADRRIERACDLGLQAACDAARAPNSASVPGGR